VRPEVEPILATARDLFGRVVYTHETHERERIIWTKKVERINWWNIITAALTTVLAIIAAAFPNACWTIATAVSAGVATGCALWQASNDPAGKEGQHRVAAKELRWCRQQLLMLIADCHIDSIPVEQLRRSLEVVNRELHAVYKFAANTSPDAFAAAEASIKSGHFSFSDDEIDALLPVALRKSAKP
jgi:hypothetical protein